MNITKVQERGELMIIQPVLLDHQDVMLCHQLTSEGCVRGVNEVGGVPSAYAKPLASRGGGDGRARVADDIGVGDA